MTSASPNWDGLATAWADQEYVRLRLNPAPADHHYLVLSDLRIFLERFRTTEAVRVLDFGAGPSPYRSLFPHADYRRADYVPSPGLTYVVDRDSRVPEVDRQFDLILSTQVAEHLPNPGSYFREALRLLRPGGRLVVTTHGIWPDHGTPYDFQRWTAAGLARDLARIGFVNLRSYKLTAGLRGHMFLALDALSALQGGRTRLRNLAARTLQRVLRLARPMLHRRVDRTWPNLRITDLGEDPVSGPPFYIVVAIQAERPAS